MTAVSLRSAGALRGPVAPIIIAWSAGLCLLVATVLVSCGYESADDIAWQRQAVACPGGGNVKPPPRSFSSGVEGYASYVGQSTCSPTAKPGVIAFRDLVLATYPCTSSGGIIRGCSVGGKSEHKEGRAWDWMVNVGHPAADALLDWLLATDAKGNRHANARRLGIMYIVWNRRMWRAYRADEGWGSYSGSNPHTDHVHFSFSWAGANRKTSYWSGTSGCKRHCEGEHKIVDENCGVGDCSVYGCRCVDDELGVRCAFFMCPDQGKATVCVDDKTLGECDDGALKQTKCSTQGSDRCAMNGATTASCISPECDAGSGKVHRNRETCLPDGRIARCGEDGKLQTPRACPGSVTCALYEGAAGCEPPPQTDVDDIDDIGESAIPGGGRIAADDGSGLQGGCALGMEARPAGLELSLVGLLLICLLRRRRRRGARPPCARGRSRDQEQRASSAS